MLLLRSLREPRNYGSRRSCKIDDRSINATSICTRARPVAKKRRKYPRPLPELVELVQNRLQWLP